MADYIASRYTNPAGAWEHELTHGWYDKGGYLPTGASIAINNTGHPERVLGPGQGGAQEVTVKIEFSGSGASDQALVSLFKEIIRARGGKVQAVMGTGPG